MPFILIALFLAAFVGGGISTAASHSLPGELLYVFKVGVNERVTSLIAVTPMSKAQWHVEEVQARLAEAAQLAAQGKLDSTTQAQLSADFDQHAQKLSEQINTLEIQGDFAGAAAVAAQFQNVVAQGAAQLDEHASAQLSEDSHAALSTLIEHIRTSLSIASRLSVDAATKAAARTAPQVPGNTDKI
ncbi:MAG: hypothetical protein JWO43_354 [Candidatus Adlerbacteria bacterium]|nr:hypothetical protein [Candidatus Adlerbacteria bacterium]